MSAPVRLVGDVGGTNARFALVDTTNPHGFVEQRTLACADYESPEDAIHSYLADLGASAPSRICVAAAGPIVDGTVRFTNNAWTLQEERLQQTFGAERARLINDFEAIAHALPWLGTQDVLALGGIAPTLPPSPGFRFAVIGPGTGLGAGALLDRQGSAHAIVSEAGHAGFAPESAEQDAVVRELRGRFGRISAERLISGPGVVNLYKALARLRGLPEEAMDAAGIFAAAQSSDHALATDTVALFHEMLGQAAGDLALSLGTYDGVFVAGGVAQRAPELLAASRFRDGFEHKGRHRELLERVPTALIVHPQPGLLGATALLD